MKYISSHSPETTLIDTYNFIGELEEYTFEYQGKWVNNNYIKRKVYTGLNFGGTRDAWTNTGATLIQGAFSPEPLIINAWAKRSSDNAVIKIFSFRRNGNNIQYYTSTTFANCDILIIDYIYM